MAKQIKQYVYQQMNELPEKTIFPNNTEKGNITRLVMHSAPGNKFIFNNNDNTPNFIMNQTGYFSLECEDYPIIALALADKENFKFGTPTIIDIVYEEEG